MFMHIYITQTGNDIKKETQKTTDITHIYTVLTVIVQRCIAHDVAHNIHSIERIVIHNNDILNVGPHPI